MRSTGATIAVVLALTAAIPAATSTASPVRQTQGVARAAGINAEPSMRPWRYHGANPDGWWCRRPRCHRVRDGTVFVDRELPLMAGLGIKNLRLEFPWPLLQPRRGRFDWRRSDYIVRKARRYGIRIQPILVFTPSWAARGLTDPPRARDFSRFVKAFATRYRRSFHHYEMWNEPNAPRFWNGPLRQYVNNVLAPGYKAVKRADRGARVLLGGPTTADIGWLEGLYGFGGGKYFDILAFHDYAADRRILEHAWALKRLLEAHGQGHKPIWLGEYGIQGGGLDADVQQWLIRLVLTSDAPIAMAQWYTLRDDHNVTCCPPRSVLVQTYGLVTDRYVKKKSYDVMRRTVAELRRR